MSYPNQKMILIKRSSENVRKDFLKIANDNLALAMYNLSANTFKLWIYLVDNANGYRLDLYPIDFCSKAKVSDSTYRRAFKELEAKGYLLKSKRQQNLYLFQEVSLIAERPDIVNSLDRLDFETIEEEFFKDDLIQNE